MSHGSEVQTADGKKLDVTKLNKNTWFVDTTGPLIFRLVIGSTLR